MFIFFLNLLMNCFFININTNFIFIDHFFVFIIVILIIIFFIIITLTFNIGISIIVITIIIIIIIIKNWYKFLFFWTTAPSFNFKFIYFLNNHLPNINFIQGLFRLKCCSVKILPFHFE